MSIFLVIKLNEFENQKTNKKNANHNNNLSIDVRSIDWKKTRIGKQTKKNWKKRENKHQTHNTHASDDVIRKTKNSFEEFDFFFFWWGEIQFTKYVINCFFKKKQLIFEEYFE